MNDATLRSNTVNSLVWKLFERGGNAIVQLIVQIIMARLLAPEEFGALAIMLVFVNLGSMFVISGFNTALVQSPEVDEGDCSTVFCYCFDSIYNNFLIRSFCRLILWIEFSNMAVACSYSRPRDWRIQHRAGCNCSETASIS